MIEPKEKFIQEICCFERAKQLIRSINFLWCETYEDKENEEFGISFGCNGGYVIYNYTTSKLFEIKEIIKEIKDDSNN